MLKATANPSLLPRACVRRFERERVLEHGRLVPPGPQDERQAATIRRPDNVAKRRAAAGRDESRELSAKGNPPDLAATDWNQAQLSALLSSSGFFSPLNQQRTPVG